MEYKYKSGYVLGKFMPLHLGHKYLIDTALKNSEKVFVLVGTLPSEPIPGDIRFKWVKELYKDEPRVTVGHCDEILPQYPEEHEDFWNIWTDVTRRYVPQDIDCIFTSEKYGEPYAKYLGIDHFLVDLERLRFPVSGTKIRNYTSDYWEFLPSHVRPYFVKRVALMGPESVGKSTMCQSLAKYFVTQSVSEFGRDVYEFQGFIALDDFKEIMVGQKQNENYVVKDCNKVIFCDTECITTYLFSKLFYPDEYQIIEEDLLAVINGLPKYDLYLLLSPDVPGVQDGTRQFLEKRWDHYFMIKSELKRRGLRFQEISGSYKERFEACKQLVQEIL